MLTYTQTAKGGLPVDDAENLRVYIPECSIKKHAMETSIFTDSNFV